MKNYYEILEVNPKASDEIIKKIYKIKIKKNHPDLFQGEEKKKAEEITKELTEAYDILSDAQKRKDYDIELQNDTQEDSQYYKYQALISNLKEENEYLKNVIKSKNNVINEFIQTTTNTFQYKSDQDYHRYYRDQENYENYENSGTGTLTTRFNWVYNVESSRLTCSGEYNLEWTVTGFSDEYIVLDRLDFDGDNIRTILKCKK